MPVRCKETGCGKIANFGLKDGYSSFCSIHKTEDMVNVNSKTCLHEGCEKRPTFDKKGGKGSYCATHKTAEMIDVKSKRCLHEGCEKQSTFDKKGGKGSYCATHKTAEMIDVKSKRCAHEGCTKAPSFDKKGGKGSHCATHKTAEMVDVKSKRCLHEGCDKVPTFDKKAGKGSYCATHKTAEMVDVKNKRCVYIGCDSISPPFDKKGGKGSYCATHRSSEMINVKDKHCSYIGCNIGALYGKPGLSRTHCAKHREKGMIRKPNAKCSDCKELAVWGTNWTPLHCESHKTEDDENLVERPCGSCNLLYVLDKTDKCENCNPESWATARLAKQNALMDYLDARGLKAQSTDTVVEGGLCGKERPDRVYDFGDKIVVLECDEHQHQERACLCEQTRMVNLGQTFGGLPVYFIRWNPDNYSPESIRKNPEVLAKRHKLCGDLIADIKKGKGKGDLPVALVAAIYLYYDGWSSLADAKWEILTALE